jgi:UDP-N-acetylglucosamine 2-epimerase
MTSKRKILVVFGTRPEALKCFPVVREALSTEKLDTYVCVTAQHRAMLDSVLQLTGMKVHYDLNVMRSGQTLFDTTSRVLAGMEEVLARAMPDFVLVQGDTTTAMSAALAAFYKRIKVGHIEAGLRSGDKYSPWPEEVNRKIVGEIADLHFAPTTKARDNLLGEAKPADRIFVTGNTAIDTLLHFSSQIDLDERLKAELSDRFPFLDPRKKLIVVTSHRRENFDGGLNRICVAIRQLAARRDVQIVYAVHPNPNVQRVVEPSLRNVAGVHLIPPQDYLPFVFLLKRAHIVLTDSGGVQEEAPSLAKPVLVLRENTERPEGIEAGTAKLVGTDTAAICEVASRLLDDEDAYAQMSKRHNPYGDGSAAKRIIGELLSHG